MEGMVCVCVCVFVGGGGGGGWGEWATREKQSPCRIKSPPVLSERSSNV